ncbi:MAG: SpoIIE family protein phosphatase [Anaerovoracaceae bacterium]|nr:SpoIIE family protein phosphatase [Anaerovoracaceae bacterium]
MQNTTAAGAVRLSKAKIIHAVTLIIFTAIVCRGPLMGDSFIIGISLIAYMLSKNTINLYLIIPAAAGLLPYISRGMEPMPYIASMIVCGLVFVSSRRIRLKLWHRGVIAACTSIVTGSIYRLATGSVYMTSPEKMLLEAGLIFVFMYVFDAVYCAVQRADGKSPGAERTLAGACVVVLLMLNGAGLSFAIWMAMVFMALWALICLGSGAALQMTAAGGLAAALMGEGQWGIMVTVMLGILAASYAARFGAAAQSVVFAAACQLSAQIESGVVLGMDIYCLLIPVMLFLVVYWRLGDSMRKTIYLLAGKKENAEDTAGGRGERLMKEKAAHMQELAELYSTYMDSRSVLAGQFNVTKQIIDDIRWQVSRQGRRAAARENEKYDVDIAISQCAASGGINGDCCGWQDIGGNRTVMVISDGMGKGKKAAAESLMVTKTIMSLLQSGVTIDLALKMINTIMLMKDDEDSYATLDMVIVDRHSGNAKFYKIGAAPTLIRRKSNVEEVKLSAVPLGIVNGLKVSYVETDLKRGDWIIMMSDGVSDGGEGRGKSGGRGFLGRIKDTAACIRSTDPQTMCDLLMDKAADSYIGKERDDLTVMVAHIV